MIKDYSTVGLHPAEGEQNGKTLLFMEDLPLVRDATVELLVSNGYAVWSASNGDEGLGYFRAHSDNIACILSDIDMPLLSGLESYERMLEIRRTPAIFITGWLDTERKEKIQELGAAHIDKPYSGKDLLALIRESLSR